MMDPLTPPTTMDADPQQTLLGLLQQIQTAQQQPLIPQNWGNAAAAPLLGFAAGMRGQANPLVDQGLRVRQAQMNALSQQATIAAAVDAMEHRRMQDMRAARRDARLDEKDSLDRAQRLKEFTFKTFTELGKHADPSVRRYAFGVAQQGGILPGDLDITRAAEMAGPDFETKHDQVLAIVASAGNPFDKAVYGDRYPVEVFGPIAIKAKDAVAKGGAIGVNELRFKKESPENVLKARLAYLSTIEDGTLTESERREKSVLEKLGKKSDEDQTQVERLATTLGREWTADPKNAGKLPPSRSALIEEANDRLSDRVSFMREIKREAKRLGLAEGSAGYYQFVRGEELALAGARAAVREDSTRLPERERAVLTVLDQGQRVLEQLMANFTLEERKKYAGWFNYKGRQLAQALAADPKFAQFRALVNQGKSMAFSDGGKQLTQYEGGITFGWVPTAEELSWVDFEEKTKLAYERLDFTRNAIIRNAVKSSKDFERGLTLPKPNTGRKWKEVSPGVWAEQ